MTRSGLCLFLLLFLTQPPTLGWSLAPTGEELFRALGCRGCHRLDKAGGSRGPALDGLGKRLSPEQLRQLLTQRREGSVMPSYDHLTDPELANLLDYLRER